MRVLLDSNVWRYVSDAHAVGTLRAVARKTGTTILVAPAVLYEALRLQEPVLRRNLAETLTLRGWQRLMPEAFSEAEELKTEIRRARPHWVRRQPDLASYRRLRFDWIRREGGVWTRARIAPEKEHAAITHLGRGELDQAREHAVEQRKAQLFSDRKLYGAGLKDIKASPIGSLDGWNGEPVEFWRFSGMQVFAAALRDPSTTYFEWTAGEINVSLALRNRADWNRFWFYDLRLERMRRCWLRAAFEFMQAYHKVTDGTPVDAQLATYLVEADIVISADKTFVMMAERCRREAPFATAKGEAIPGGMEGVNAILARISELG